MSDERLFSVEDYPEVPILREPRRAGAAVGVIRDARFKNDYPPSWDRCVTCEGEGRTWGELIPFNSPAPRHIAAGESVYVEWTMPETFVIREWDSLGVLAATDIGEPAGFRLRDQVCPD